eukprot:Tamp_11398.p2 GENE.Tamp_11398~~Tamp_11398.p2  ORF type:complete len:244 (-),score=42.75 Tamp_11398:252-983(-)
MTYEYLMWCNHVSIPHVSIPRVPEQKTVHEVENVLEKGMLDLDKALDSPLETLERAARGEASSPGGIAPVAMPPAAIAPAQRAQEDHHIHISPISVVAFFLLHGRDATGRKGTGCGVWLAVGFGCLHCCFGMPVCAAALAGLLACQCAQLLYPGRDRGGQRAAAAWHAADLMPYSRAREQAAAAQSELWLDADQPLGKPPSVIPMGAPQAESPTHQEKAGPAILAPDAVGNGVRTDKTIVSVL